MWLLLIADANRFAIVCMDDFYGNSSYGGIASVGRPARCIDVSALRCSLPAHAVIDFLFGCVGALPARRNDHLSGLRVRHTSQNWSLMGESKRTLTCSHHGGVGLWLVHGCC